MGNPLLLLWHRIFDPEPRGPDDAHDRPSESPDPVRTTGPIFLVLRRMRVPLIVLVVVFALSVLGLTLIPGQQPDGGTRPMGFFEAFYFMSYTATTIGFGEIPDPLTTGQRLWVTFSIYVAVIGWAYAIGTLLALLQDRGFRKALESRGFARRVRRIPEPFHIVVGYGEAGALVARDLDAKGRRLVVVDRAQDRIDALALEALRAEVPALSASASAPDTLLLAGLRLPRCEGVLALTDDDDTNLAVVQAVHLLRPGLPVIARADTGPVAHRMAAFGAPTVINPFDAFGDRLRTTLRTPTLAQLIEWLVLPPGVPLPARPTPPAEGSWVVVGADRAVGEVTRDLVQAGVQVTGLDPARDSAGPEEAAFAETVGGAAGLVAVAERDTLNISYVDAARRANPGVFVVARQESPANEALFAALAPDILLVPAEVVAREALEQLATPELAQFLVEAGGQPEAWAADLLDALVRRCGPASPTVWQVPIDPICAPALHRRLGTERVSLGALILSPFGRAMETPLVALMLTRADQRHLTPDPSVELHRGDVLLVAGGRGARRAWDALLFEEDALSYVLSGQSVATSWWGRRLLGSRR